MFDLGKRFLIALKAAERKYQYDYSDLHGAFLTGELDDEARHARVIDISNDGPK